MRGATNMTHQGFSHIGLSTLDLDKTRAFYEGVLGFKPVVADTITIEEGGHLRHMFFDVGGGQLIAFLEPNGIPDVPAKYDAGINRGLGVPAGFYHFAFEAGSPTALAKKRDELGARVSRRQKSWTTDGRGRSISKIPMGSRSNIAAWWVDARRVMRRRTEHSRCGAPHWNSPTPSPKRDRPATEPRRRFDDDQDRALLLRFAARGDDR